MMDPNELFSRETAAGRDRAVLDQATVVLVGAGAAGNYLGMQLASAGVHEVRIVDMDRVGAENLTRSPFFRREHVGAARPMHKARALARGILATSYAPDPVVRFATVPVEQLGLGALVGAGVVVSAVDSLPARAYLADATRLLGVPLVEVGFARSRGQVSVFPNLAAEEPCWRCLHPHAGYDDRVSCETYAAAAAAAGFVPTTPTLAGFFGALAAEAALQALHRQFPLGGRVFQIDMSTGRTCLLEVAPNEDCPGVHRRYDPITRLDVRADAPLRAVFKAARATAAEPVVHLPTRFLVEAPCRECGAPVPVDRPAWQFTAPTCAMCPPGGPEEPGALVAVKEVAKGDALAARRCRALGLPPGAVFEVADAATGTLHAVQLAGGAPELFHTLTRRAEGADDAVEAQGFTIVSQA